MKPRPYLAQAGADLARTGTQTRIHVDPAEPPSVQLAARRLADDLHALTGTTATISSATGATSGDAPGERPQIIVGTIGISAMVDAAIAAGLIDVTALRDDGGIPRWESFLIAVGENGTLHLVGGDPRGTVFAVSDFAEAAGVSPWHWWASIPIRRRHAVTLAPGSTYADWPSVRYRGVFLNDEEELYHWARAHTNDTTIGPETYRRVYELILRLKGNYLWPAMHVGAFNHDPENGRLANEMGVVIGSSHCDMLLRSNQHEFEPWESGRTEPVVYDYSIPGRNRDELREYWRGSVEQNRHYEVTWTVGMRGIHDTGFVTSAIDADDSLSEEERLRARVELLEGVIRDQRAILGETLGVDPAAAPQLFIPYKEVLPLYDAGLTLPDDVTTVWANDNFGYIRRFPSPVERARPGGHGLYYHSSYWSNMVTSYLATSSTPLALMKSELRKAWEHGIQELWVDNIGGLKPLEIEMEFFLRSAWEAGKESTARSVELFVCEWVDATFSGGHGPEAGRIYAEYYALNNQRKIEHLTAGAFTQTGFGDEANQRLAALWDLCERTNGILAALPAAERDAFAQAFALKIHMAYLVSAQFAYADRSTLASKQGKLAAADHYLSVSRECDAHKRALIHSYNHVLSGGAWSEIFTPEQFPPPVLPLYPAATPSLTIAGRGIGIVTWGEDLPSTNPSLTFYPYGIPEKWIEVFSTGVGEVSFEIDADPWLDVSVTSGTVTTERRIAVRPRDPLADGGRKGRLRIASPETGQQLTIAVTLAPAPTISAGFMGAIEADGYISIDPAHADRTVPGSHTCWESIPYLGRYGTAAVQVHAIDGAPTPTAASARLEYGIHLRTPGSHILELHRLPTLNATGQIRVGIGVDGADPIELRSPTTDEHRGTWELGVQDNVDRLRLRLPHLGEGPHTLSLHAIDPGVTLSKIVLYTRTPPPSNLGPAFSQHTARPHVHIPLAHPEEPPLSALAALTRSVYRTDPSVVPLPEQIYVGRDYYGGDTVFQRSHAVPQRTLGSPLSPTHPDGSKDLRAALGHGVVVENGGILAWEAENVLAGDGSAWATPGREGATWTHTQAETNGRTGLAMHVLPRGQAWHDPAAAPGLHYTLDVATPGRYAAWLLVKYDDTTDDSCLLAVDGTAQPASAQLSGGGFCTYATRQAWVWLLVSDLRLDAGRRVFSILAAKSGLRVDRIYLTLGDELPPLDAEWNPSTRLSPTI